MGTPKNLTGMTFGKLTALKAVGKNKHNCYLWKCVCLCGNTSIVATNDLTSGNTQSCGCQKGTPTHRKTKTRLYRIWRNMKQRCFNPQVTAYHTYGGRGITVYEEWRLCFESFEAWAIEHGYSADKELDRIDTNGNYEPSNCRWITHKENCRNRRTNHFVEINGDFRTFAEWGEIAGISPRTIYYRYSSGIRGPALIAEVKRKK